MCDLRASKYHRLFHKGAEWPTYYPARSIGVRLPTDLKLGMERLTGLNLNQVRVHYASPLPALVHAHGYAQGNQIYLALGQEHHLPHELGHVVQQMWGMVEATTEVNGVAVNDDPKLEEHATKLGQLALNAGVNHGRHFRLDRHVSSLKALSLF